MSPAGTPEKDPRRVPGEDALQRLCFKCARFHKVLFVNVPATQHTLSTQEILILFKSQLPIWYCQNVYNFVPKSFFVFFFLGVGK